MSESLIGRVARLVGGTFTSILDSAENAAPELVARQALEEIDKAIADVRVEIGRKQANRHNANRELTSLNDRAEALKSQIQTAVQEQRDDLAESGTRELVGIEDRIPIIESLVASTQEEEQELGRYLAGLRSKRDEMERDYQQIRQRASATVAETSVGGGIASSDIDGRVERAGNAINRVKTSATGVPAGNHSTDASARAELEELHLKNRVAERLAALKKES